MSEVDRPIKPDQKYLEEYLQRINKVETRPFLKKGQKSVLPCYLNNKVKVETKEKRNETKTKTKAEIYEEIKERNLKKFGQKKVAVNIQQNTKKIHPKRMTIDCKPKPHIQTEQYKMKNHIPQPKSQRLPLETKEKLEYEKLIEYFNKEVKELQRQKEEFEKLAEKLRFKESIRKEEGLLYSRVKSQVQKRIIKADSDQGKSQQKNIRTNIQSRENPNKMSKKTQQLASPKHENLSKTYSVGDIRNKLSQTCQQMQAIKTQMLHHNIQITQHKYQIFQAHLLPNFEPQAIYDYIDLSKLKYNGNSHYQAALAAFNSKFEKENKPCDDLCEANQSSLKTKVKEKYVGDKRISKYNGWTEVWIAGKQRLMTNSEHYKVIWLSNGDVLQQFSTSIKTYYSKVKDICKIEYKDQPAIYYHEKLKQIWRYLPNNSREVVFENGRVEIVEETS